MWEHTIVKGCAGGADQNGGVYSSPAGIGAGAWILSLLLLEDGFGFPLTGGSIDGGAILPLLSMMLVLMFEFDASVVDDVVEVFKSSPVVVDVAIDNDRGIDDNDRDINGRGASSSSSSVDGNGGGSSILLLCCHPNQPTAPKP
jgi:hypothetical protein